MAKILIIKLGYSETLDKNISTAPSLGDVLRTTVIVNFFKNDCVTWLVDKNASALLEGNKYIKRILFYEDTVFNLLRKEKFDAVINLEKLPGICALSDSLETRKFFGFGSKAKGAEELDELSRSIEKRRQNQDCWQNILARAIGERWRGQPYVLGYKPKSGIEYDIGLNLTTSNKWTNKAWPKEYWDELSSLIKGRYSVSRQKGMDNLCKYMDWINSCRLIISADTLGLHLALALKKRVIALFGPTSPSEIHLYNCGISLTPDSAYKRIPCLNG